MQSHRARPPPEEQLTLLLASIATLVILASGCQSEQGATQTPYYLIYSAKSESGRAVHLADEEGSLCLRITSATPSDGYPAASPDGKHIAFYGKYDDYKTWSIHRIDVDGANMQRLTDTPLVWDSAPSWSSDGATIMFSREYQAAEDDWREEIWLMDADGGNQRQIETLKGRAASFMPDGRVLFQSKTGPSQICLANLDGSNLVCLTDNEANDRSPKISPDASTIAFLSNRDGNQEVYLMDVDGANPRRMTFNDVEDWDPAWSGDGQSLFFSSANGQGFYDLYAVHRDGHSLRKVLDGVSQTASARYVDPAYLKRLKASRVSD